MTLPTSHQAGRVIRERREARGLSVEELSSMVGIKPIYLRGIERASSRPGRALVERLANILYDTPDDARAFTVDVLMPLPSKVLDRVILDAIERGENYDGIQRAIAEARQAWRVEHGVGKSAEAA